MKKCLVCSANPNEERLSFLPTTINKMVEFDSVHILTCSECGFGFVEKDFNNEKLNSYYQNYYSGIADKSENHDFSNLRSKYEFNTRVASQIALLNNFFDKSKPIKILEIGPGRGDFLYAISKKNWNAKTYVFEPQLKAQKMLKSLKVEIIPESFNSDTISKYTNFFDLIYMSHALEHFNPGDINETIRLIKKSLTKNGLFFCEIPNADLNKTPFEAIVPHLSFFSLNSIKILLEKNVLNIKFLNTCGKRYDDKITHDMQIDFLEKQNSFEFYPNKSGDILINKKLMDSKNNKKIFKIFFFYLIKILPINIQLKLKDIKHRLSNASLYENLSSDDFSYGDDREFIRVVAQKID